MCRNCGAIVAAGETACPQCGAAVGAAAAASQAETPRATRAGEGAPDPATMRFARALFSRPATFTLLFVIANVVIHLLKAAAEIPGAPQVALVEFGAKVNQLIDEPNNQWWRFVTPIFLHVNLVHLVVNMYGLWSLGPYVERLYGSARFVVIWVVTGIAGVAASYYTVRTDVDQSFINDFLFRSSQISAGASGALFGLIGVLFVFGIKFRHELPEGFKRAFGTGMLPTILINIVIGYFLPFIDNAAHMGGLAAGALLASVIGYKRIGPREAVAYLWHLLQACALALVVASFALVAYNYTGATPELANLLPRFTDPRSVNNYLQALSAAQSAFAQTATSGDIAPAEQGIALLRDAPVLDDDTTRLRDDLRVLLERLRDHYAQAPARRRTEESQTELLAIQAGYNDWQQRNTVWLLREAPRYGVNITAAEPVAAPATQEQVDPAPDGSPAAPPNRPEPGSRPNAAREAQPPRRATDENSR